MKIPFAGGEIELGTIPAYLEGTCLAVVLVPARTYNGNVRDPYYEVGIFTEAGAVSLSYDTQTPPAIEQGKRYRFAVGISNDSYGQAKQPRVRLVSFAPAVNSAPSVPSGGAK